MLMTDLWMRIKQQLVYTVLTCCHGGRNDGFALFCNGAITG